MSGKRVVGWRVKDVSDTSIPYIVQCGATWAWTVRRPDPIGRDDAVRLIEKARSDLTKHGRNAERVAKALRLVRVVKGGA